MKESESSRQDPQLGFEFQEPEPAPREANRPEPRPAPSHSELLESLRRATRARPLGRKILVAETRGEGRELLRALARAGCPWVGWEVLTPRPLALELAGAALRAEGLSLLDEFDEQALLDRAMDDALEEAGTDAEQEAELGFEALSEAVGFRGALAGAVRALRLGGVSGERLSRARFEDSDKKALLLRALHRYESALASAERVDGAGLLRRATDRVTTDGIDVLGATLYLTPGLSLRGYAGAFIRALIQAGAEVLTADPVRGLEAPSGWLWQESQVPRTPLASLHAAHEARAPVEHVGLFSGASVEEELREVLRRVVTQGRTWDQVEILTPDPQVYGSALHALASRLEIPVTFGVGLQVGRTRPGRALSAYFRWIEGGFQAAEVRRLLESGDLRPTGDETPDAMALGRRFRELRIGWGRERTRKRILERIDATKRAKPHSRDFAESFAARQAEAAAELEALRALLFPILDATPRIPKNPLARAGGSVSPAALANGVRRFLSFVPVDHPVDVTAMERLDHVLARIVATLVRPTSYAAAAAAVRTHLRIRVPAPRAEGKAPWSSDGGHLYLTDLEHGGFTGRAVTFVVGLDASRFPGTQTQDPLLLDRERHRIGGTHLPTSGDQIQGRRFRLAALLARLRGRVTLSWCAWDPSEARGRAPAAELLQACRWALGNPSATFADLRALVGPPVGVIPDAGAEALDGRDVWMSALASGGALRQGRAVVGESFPRLARGDRVTTALETPEATAYLGQVDPRPEFDPRTTDQVLSASRVEALGTCPRRYFYSTVLRLRPRDDPDYDPDRWLDAKARGSLLHTTYERFLRAMRTRGWNPMDPAVLREGEQILRQEADRTLDELPAPSEEVRLKELHRLMDDFRSFLGMIAQEGASWLDLEVKFGFGAEPVSLPVVGGRVLVRGRIDRVDEREGTLYVVDYKTGSPFSFTPNKAVFNEGRRLQHYVYTVAVRALYGRSAAAVEYHFPTHKHLNQRIAYTQDQLRIAPALMGKLFDVVRDGHFLPTEEKNDCLFCDFGAVCRVRLTQYNKVDRSPPAEWASRFMRNVEEYRPFRTARRMEEEEPPGSQDLLEVLQRSLAEGGSPG